MPITDDQKYYLTTLTRYLYSRIEVKQSLFISLLQRDVSQALFWGYELYYSGFQEETFDFIKDIYQEIYEKLNPDLQTIILNMLNEWNDCDSNEKDCKLGSIIYTLSQREYDMVAFAKSKLSYNITNDTVHITEHITPLCICTMLPEHIELHELPTAMRSDFSNCARCFAKRSGYSSTGISYKCSNAVIRTECSDLF